MPIQSRSGHGQDSERDLFALLMDCFFLRPLLVAIDFHRLLARFTSRLIMRTLKYNNITMCVYILLKEPPLYIHIYIYNGGSSPVANLH